jgi:PAS domain S-box-containing protein
LLQIFEMGILGLLASLLLYQDYKGRLGLIWRQPLIAVPWAGLTTWLLTYLSIYVYTDQNLSALSAVSTSMLVDVANLPVVLIQSVVAGAILQAVYAIWPKMRAVERPARTPPYARSISLRFLFFFLPSAAIVLVVVLYAVMAQALRIAVDQSIDQVAHVASNVSSQLPFFSWTGQQLLGGLALDDALQSAEYSKREDSLERGIKTVPFFSQILMIDKDDPARIPRIIVPNPETGQQELTQLTPEEHSLIELTLRDCSPQVGPVHKNAMGTPIISFLVPIRSFLSPQDIVGALVGRVHIPENYQLESMISNLQPPGTQGTNRGVGFLINKENQIVVHEDYTRVLETWEINPNPIVFHDSPTPLAVVYEDMNGPNHTRQLVYVLETEGVPWRIVVLRPFENVLSQATEISSPLTFLFLVGGLITSIGVPVFTARLTRPLQELSRAAGEIAAEHLDIVINVSGEDEVGQLGRSFEQMRRRLRERMDELYFLLQISRQVSSSIELEPTLTPILVGAIQATGGNVARIVLLDGRGRPGKAVSSGTPEACRAMIRLDQAVEAVVKSNRELQIEDIVQCTAASPGELLHAGVRAAIGLPLRLQDRVTGVLWVGYGRARHFVDNDLRFLYTLAGQAAVVAVNAQLFEDVEAERARLSAILNSTNDAVIVVDERKRLLLSNPAAMRTYGIVPYESVGLPIEQLTADAALRDLFARPMDVGSAVRDEIKAPDGRTFSASISLLGGGGRVVTLRDITYLKELDQMKSDFVNTVSHDLRSPLTYMRGYTSMLAMVGEVNEKQDGYLTKILAGIEQMTALIDDLLDIGKIEAGVGIEIERCWLPGIVQAVVDDLGLRAKEQEIELVASLPADIPPTLADRTLVRQAIKNLIENAIKYTPGPGRVDVALRVHNGSLVVSVRDTGIGIALEDQQRLFEKFYRIKRRDTVHIKGTGLGLAIVKSIADRHSGRTWVESKLDEGSTFYLSIPLIPPDELPGPAEP